MKKLILVMVLIFAFAIPVMASPIEISGTFTTEAEYDLIDPYDLLSSYNLKDTIVFTAKTEFSETTSAEATLTVDELIFGTVGLDVSGKLCFDLGEGESAELGVDVDLLTYDLAFGGKYLGLPISDDMLANAKVQYKYPTATYYGVANLIYGSGEDVELILEARYDSDGAELFSAEAQVNFAISSNIDLKVGYEYNDWSDGINDWDACEIVSDSDKVYGKLVISF